MVTKNKSLVILTPGFPSSEEDSTCLPLQQHFLRTLHAMHPQLNIIILSFQYPYVRKKYNWFSSTVFSYSGRNKGGLARLLLRQQIYSTLEDIHASTRITGLLSFWLGECALTGKRFAERHGLKHYCWTFGQDAKKENKYGKRACLDGNELIALSDFLQEEFEKNHATRPQHVIPLGISLQQFTTTKKQKDIDILGAGSLIPLKQYDIFLQIIADIKKQLPAIKVMLVGNGPEKENLQELINKSGLKETVVLTGEISHTDVLKLMQRTKVFLHPSSYEGFSGVCLEALYNGAHVVSFCRAMNQDIDQWHIVKSPCEMKQKTLEILQDTATSYKNVNVVTAEETVHKVMTLFN